VYEKVIEMENRVSIRHSDIIAFNKGRENVPSTTLQATIRLESNENQPLEFQEDKSKIYTNIPYY
jgi:hypothetical protein